MKKKGDILIYLAVSMSCQVVGQQRLFCEQACSVGSTCAMLKVGDGDAKPGCINQIETEMLAKALRQRPSPGQGASIQASVNVQRITGTSANIVHSHDTEHGIVTHRHEIPRQSNKVSGRLRPLPRGSRNTPTKTVSTSFDFPQPPLSFREAITFDRFMSQRPLRLLHRVPIQSPPSEFNALTPFSQTDGGVQSGNINSGLSFVSDPTDKRRSMVNSRMLAYNPNVIQETFQPSNNRFAAFPVSGECGRRCDSHLECLQSEFCGRSTLCRGAIVCQIMQIF